MGGGKNKKWEKERGKERRRNWERAMEGYGKGEERERKRMGRGEFV